MSKRKKEKRKGAVAIGYNQSADSAPKVLAKGLGKIAEEIIEKAKKEEIFIKEDQLLFESLYKLDVGSEVPPKLYQTIAELLAFIYRINDKKKRGYI